MNKILLNFYSYRVFIEDLNQIGVLERVFQDFSYFVEPKEAAELYSSAARPSADLCISINTGSLNIKKGLPVLKTRMCTAKQVSLKKRFYQYSYSRNLNAELLLEDLFENKFADLRCDNVDLAFEIVYLLVLSSVGENLESRGIMRLHACGVQYSGKSHCFWGARKEGKSTLVLNLLTLKDLRVYSDENTLFDLNSNLLLPFPIRLAANNETFSSLDQNLLAQLKHYTQKRFFLDEKTLMQFPEDRLAAPGTMNSFFILGSRENIISLKNLDFFKFIHLFINILLGIGIIQMAEFFVRPTNVLTLVKIFFNRIRLFRKILGVGPQLWLRSPSLKENLAYCKNSILLKGD